MIFSMEGSSDNETKAKPVAQEIASLNGSGAYRRRLAGWKQVGQYPREACWSWPQQ